MRMGLSAEEVLDLATNEERLRSMGYSAEDAREWATGQEPPTKIGLVKVDGLGRKERRDPLSEHYAARDVLDEALSPRQAAREQMHFREALAQQQEQLRLEVEGAEARIEAQREQERVEAEGRAEQERIAHEQAESQRQQALQQRQADDAERLRVANLEFQANATHEERKLIETWNGWEKWAAQTPEMQSFDALKLTQQANPQRWAQLQKQVQTALQTKQAIEARLREIGETKQLRQHAVATQQQQAAQAAYRQYAESEDAKAHEMISREFPQYKTKEGRRAISEASRNMLKNLGLTDEHIKQVWADGAPINFRSAPAQAVLAKAAMWDLGQARVRELHNHKVQPPPLLRPGVARPRGASNGEAVRGLEAKLRDAKGNQSLKLATQLTKAKRAAGLL
jgi:hypothetical protein